MHLKQLCEQKYRKKRNQSMLSTWPFTITTRNQLNRKWPWVVPQASKHWQYIGPPLRYQNHIAIEHHLIILCNKNSYFIYLFLIYKLPCWISLRGLLSIHTHTQMPVAQKQQHLFLATTVDAKMYKRYFFLSKRIFTEKNRYTQLKCIAWRKGGKKIWNASKAVSRKKKRWIICASK